MSDKNAAAQPERYACVLLAPGAEIDPTWADPLAFVAAAGQQTVALDSVVLAESARAIIVHEQGHRPVSYFPRADVRLDALTSVAQTTHCPRKGDASYFAFGAVDGPVVAWSYEAPIPIAMILKDYVAFYSDKTELRKEA